MEDIGRNWPFVMTFLNQSVLENKQDTLFLSFVIFGNDISDLLCWVISYEKVTNIAPPKIDFLSTVIIIGLYSLKDDDSQFWARGDLFWVLGDYFGFWGTKETKIPNLHKPSKPAAMYLSKSLELPASRSVCKCV